MAGWSLPGNAQINPFKRYGGESLTKEDLQLIEQASAKLYKPDGVAVGTSEKWDNPKSGNKGTVTLTQLFDHQGMPCRKLRHQIKMKRSANTQTYVFNRCRVASGEWKLL